MSGYISPRVIHATGEQEITNIEGMLSKGPDTTTIGVPFGGDPPEILLDFGVKTTGYVYMDILQTSNDLLEVTYGPFPDVMFFRRVIPMSKPGLFVDNEYIALRYMKLRFINTSAMPMDLKVVISRFGLRTSYYPCIYMGGFESNDAGLGKIWQTGSYTNQLCMQRSDLQSAYYENLPAEKQQFVKTWKNPFSKYVLIDGPRRDREAWIGDIRTQALSAYYSFGATDVIKSSLFLFYDIQAQSGEIPGSGASWQVFREYNLWWLISLWEYYLFTADIEFLKLCRPGVVSMQEWLEYLMDDRGFIFNNNTWMWTIPREGYGASFQIILSHTLECIGNIRQACGEPEEKTRLDELRGKLVQNIDLEFWDDEKGVYRDIVNITGAIPVFQDTNAYAVSFGIASGHKAQRILSYLKEHMWNDFGSRTLDRPIADAEFSADYTGPLRGMVSNAKDPKMALQNAVWAHNCQIWPFINGYEVQAHFTGGSVADALELTGRCWGGMLNKGATTFWEMVDADNGYFAARSHQSQSKTDCMSSAAHGWSGWISYILQAHCLGIRPLEAGFRRFIVAPRTGDLTRVSGTVPTPYGPVKAEIIREDKNYQIHVSRPAEISAEFDWSGLGANAVIELTEETT